jgi:hypothetical protein
MKEGIIIEEEKSFQYKFVGPEFTEVIKNSM